MADAATARAALRDAHRLSGAPLGAGPDGLAGDGWLGTASDARRHCTFWAAAIPGPHLRSAPVAAVLRSTVRSEHDHPGEGPAHVPAAAADRPAELRNCPREAAGQSVA